MNEIDAADEEIGNPQHEKIVVLQIPAGIPRNDKYDPCNENGKHLNDYMREQETVERGEPHPCNDQHKDRNKVPVL
ncbi:hypothetical protein MKMG_01629 [Methanogenium sp. MK-MG]|nr:hypothetical protein MKMG_01629 [Methanogenium sp. MK-MG]